MGPVHVTVTVEHLTPKQNGGHFHLKYSFGCKVGISITSAIKSQTQLQVLKN